MAEQGTWANKWERMILVAMWFFSIPLRMHRAYAGKGSTTVVKLFSPDGKPVVAVKRISPKRLDGEGQDHLMVSCLRLQLGVWMLHDAVATAVVAAAVAGHLLLMVVVFTATSSMTRVLLSNEPSVVQLITLVHHSTTRCAV